MNLNENLSFNFSDSFYKDVHTIDTLMKKYISDRKQMYEELFCCSEYTEDDVDKYINYFTKSSCDMTQDVYENLYHIQHFLERDYEIYIQSDICDLKNRILNLVCETTYDDFENEEFDNIENLENLWEDFLNLISSTSVIDLDDMNFKNYYGVQCYLDKNTQPFVMDVFESFMKNLHKDYPNTLLKLDTILIVPKDYIQFLACDDCTQAFFTNNSLFLASSCDDCDDEEEKIFFETVLYHEYFHFIFSLMSETSQIYWANLYKEWRDKSVSMTRDDDRNSQLYGDDGKESGENIEELWADTGAMKYVGSKTNENFYIHKPSSLISDSQDFILRNEFV